MNLVSSGFDPGVLGRGRNRKLDDLWGRLLEVPYFADRPGVAERRLESVPITPKSALKENPSAFLRKTTDHYHKYYETSGTTGVPTPTPRLVTDTLWNTVSVATVWERTLRPGDRVASLLPSDVAPVSDLIANVAEYLGCTMLRSYPFAQGISDWERLDALFTGYRPQHVFAAPGVVLQWTRLLKERGRLAEVSRSVRSLMLLGEVSTPPLRARIGEQWQATVLDASYGSTETGTIAAGCEHDRQHLLLQSHLVEILDGDVLRPAAPGLTGELVVTTLNNFARPLVRYNTGDLVTVGADCPCGLALPVVRVHGRATESIGVGGVRLTAEAIESIIYGAPGITGYLVQLKRPDGQAGRLVLERDVDATGPDEDLREGLRSRFAEIGVQWSQIVSVAQLPKLSKAGGSQKNWKRTNLQWVD
ncbi:phenylacetate--CoA ligase family protein [Kitasatospora indigofera]|uniref:phenylacetate--CoA ligase family protein n=1 Tax=Kitasatospora indigofera TaxID=67307 RepID=UPI003682DD49